MSTPTACERWDELRELLAEGPGELAFRAVCAALDTWPGPDAADALAFAEGQLQSWPDEARVAPWSWCCALRGGEAKPTWRLVRTLRPWSEHIGAEEFPLGELGGRAEWAHVT